MTDAEVIKIELEKIKKLPLDMLFFYYNELRWSVLTYRMKEKAHCGLGDSNYFEERILTQVSVTLFNKLVNLDADDKSNIKYFNFNYYYSLPDKFVRLYDKYLKDALHSYFLQNMDRDNYFCKEVVASYLLTHSENKGDIKEEVKKWFNKHNSPVFKKSIAQSVIAEITYMSDIGSMIEDYVQRKISNEKRWG